MLPGWGATPGGPWDLGEHGGDRRVAIREELAVLTGGGAAASIGMAPEVLADLLALKVP